MTTQIEKLLAQWQANLNHFRVQGEIAFFAGDKIAEAHWATICRQWQKAINDLRAALTSQESEAMSKPETVEIGQFWRHESMVSERPFCVVDIVQEKGCSPEDSTQVVPWAVFRKRKKQPCRDLLTNPRWKYEGKSKYKGKMESYGTC